MAAALMTLLQASIVSETEPSDATKPDEAKSGVARASNVEAALTQLSLGEPGTIAKKTPPCTATPSALQQLVGVAKQLAKVDEMVQSAQTAAPAKADTEAHKWHEVSLRALLWSRAALQEQQQRVLRDIWTELAAGARAGPAGAAAGAKPEEQMPHAARIVTKTKSKILWQMAKPAVESIPEEGQEKYVHPQAGSLRADLEHMKKCDPALCLLVRRIKKLGLESREHLEQHFAQFGPLKEVLVANSFDKPSPKRRYGRVRPAGVGFLVMGTPTAVEAVIAAGANHLVAGVEVSVQMFQASMDFATLAKDRD